MLRLSGALLAAVWCLVAAKIAFAENAVQLAYDLKRGSEVVYQVEGTTTITGQRQIPGCPSRMSVSGRTVFVVTDVDSDGVITVACLYLAVIDFGEGKYRYRNQGNLSVGRFDRTGRFLHKRTSGGTTGSAVTPCLILKNLVGVPLPDQPVRPGDTWSSQLSSCLVNSIQLLTAARVDSKWVTSGTRNGRQCASLKSSVTSLQEYDEYGIHVVARSFYGTARGEVETTFDVERGLPLESTATITRVEAEDGSQITYAHRAHVVLLSERVLPDDAIAPYAHAEDYIERALAKQAADVPLQGIKEFLDSMKTGDLPEDWQRGWKYEMADLASLLAAMADADARYETSLKTQPMGTPSQDSSTLPPRPDVGTSPEESNSTLMGWVIAGAVVVAAAAAWCVLAKSPKRPSNDT